MSNMWSLNGFINDLPLPCRQVKKTKQSESDLYIVWKCFISTFTWC